MPSPLRALAAWFGPDPASIRRHFTLDELMRVAATLLAVLLTAQGMLAALPAGSVSDAWSGRVAAAAAVVAALLDGARRYGHGADIAVVTTEASPGVPSVVILTPPPDKDLVVDVDAGPSPRPEP